MIIKLVIFGEKRLHVISLQLQITDHYHLFCLIHLINYDKLTLFYKIIKRIGRTTPEWTFSRTCAPISA